MSSSTPTLKKGSRGEAVTCLQEGLAHLSYDHDRGMTDVGLRSLAAP